jgi:hypothetical protein
MKHPITKFLLLSLALIASTLQAAPVAVDSQFTGGVFGAFNLNYTSGAAGLKLQEVTIDLKSPLFADPTFSGPGALLPLPFSGISGAAATGFAGVTGIFDGATSFTLLFTDFDAGESFNFNLDVDTPCGNILCLVPASLTTGSEFAGTKLTGTFGGSGYQSRALEALYTASGPITATSQMRGDVEAVPEPGTHALLSGGLIALTIVRRKRSASQ